MPHRIILDYGSFITLFIHPIRQYPSVQSVSYSLLSSKLDVATALVLASLFGLHHCQDSNHWRPTSKISGAAILAVMCRLSTCPTRQSEPISLQMTVLFDPGAARPHPHTALTACIPDDPRLRCNARRARRRPTQSYRIRPHELQSIL